MKDVDQIQVKPMVRQPAVFSAFPWVVAGESTRHGGVSRSPYASLNLGKSTDDDPAHVEENKRRFCATLGFVPEQLAWSRQVHGDLVRLVSEPGGAEGYDALITGTPDILLVVSVADCTPILIADPVRKAVAAIHAGWRGTANEIVRKTVAAMLEHFNTQPSDCYAYVGTCIDECSFEVGAEVAGHFQESVKRLDPFTGKYFVDLKQENKNQLLDCGIPEAHIQVSIYSTVLDNRDYFSHRLEKGTTGRMLGFIGMKLSD